VSAKGIGEPRREVIDREREGGSTRGYGLEKGGKTTTSSEKMQAPVPQTILKGD